MSTPATECSDVCPVCKGLALEEAKFVTFVTDDGATLRMPCETLFADYNRFITIHCVVTQTFTAVDAYIERADGKIQLGPRQLNIGDNFDIKGVWNCRACNKTGLASEAMRRRMLGIWEPK